MSDDWDDFDEYCEHYRAHPVRAWAGDTAFGIVASSGCGWFLAFIAVGSVLAALILLAAGR